MLLSDFLFLENDYVSLLYLIEQLNKKIIIKISEVFNYFNSTNFQILSKETVPLHNYRS